MNIHSFPEGSDIWERHLYEGLLAEPHLGQALGFLSCLPGRYGTASSRSPAYFRQAQGRADFGAPSPPRYPLPLGWVPGGRLTHEAPIQSVQLLFLILKIINKSQKKFCIVIVSC